MDIVFQIIHFARQQRENYAVKDYLQKMENQSLFIHLNEAYSDFPDDEER
jgi:hypothetical protein